MKKRKFFITLIAAVLLHCGLQARYYIKTLIHDDGSCSGKIEVVAEGMTAPFSYKWSNGNEGESLENLCAGIYQVEVLNKYQCSTMLEVEILKQNEAQLLSSFTKTDACIGIANGSASVTLNETAKDVRLQWDNGNTQLTRNNLPEGEHCYSLFKTLNGDVLVERNCLKVLTDPDCQKSDELILQFNVHPNPFSENLTIDIARASNLPGFGTLFIYNTAGKEVMRNELQLEAGHNSLTLPVDAELPNGVYNIKYREKGMKQPKITQIIKIN